MRPLLDSIDGPEDLKGLSPSQLKTLATEVRRLIIDVVSRNGGHLSSNLGVVELTIALHYCFDFLKDRLIWDVSHQCYAHKILTGRRDLFQTLRRKGGLSGFACPDESGFDPFAFGHAGASVSAGLGLASALAAGRGEGADGPRVVAVIGDGAIASGMPLEALNHAGEVGADLLVILNDNKMSISPTIGAFARYLDKMRASTPYMGIKREVHDLLSRWPQAREGVEGLLHRVKDGVQTALTPGGLFVELGLHYFGPVDGHETDELIEALEHVKTVRGPVLLHVLTEKGRGFDPASSDPAAFHSSGRFEMKNGKVAATECDEELVRAKKERSYSDVIGETLMELAAEDERIVAITAAMPAGTGLKGFAERFPDRFYDVGICEQHGVGFAGGLAAGGMRPVACIYSTFLQRAFDQAFHDVALQGAPVLFCIDRAGLVGSDGPTHHGCWDVALFCSLPGFVVMAPRDEIEGAAMVRWALQQDCPCAIRYPKEALPGPLGPEPEDLAVGKAEVLREGAGAAVIAYGAMVRRALEAADLIAGEGGPAVTVVNARFAKPLDEETILDVVGRHEVVLLAEDHGPAGGFASAILSMLAQRGARSDHVRRAGLPDSFIPHATREEQFAGLRLDAAGLAARLRET